ncbi:MAG: hypothetical protein IIZ67_04225 [Bacilli bacterium]|nr:hypothetical protein [Bacilli bacterium]
MKSVEERIDYDKKIELCKKLGADKFQKVVFKAEELKFRFIRRFIPRYIEHMDKLYDWIGKKELESSRKAKEKSQRIREEAKKRLSRTTSEEKKTKIKKRANKKLLRLQSKIIPEEVIKKNVQSNKILMRKEYYLSQNRNYHMDLDRPTEMLSYLEYNKRVHMNGLKRNAVFLPIFTGLSVAFPITTPLVAYELASTFINFQCVNIQNCNIYRFKQKEEKLKKIEETRAKTNIRKYGKVSSIVSRELAKTEDRLPTMDEIIASVGDDKEALAELRQLAISTMSKRNAINAKTRKKGGN